MGAGAALGAPVGTPFWGGLEPLCTLWARVSRGKTEA